MFVGASHSRILIATTLSFLTAGFALSAETPSFDRGAAGVWQKLLKLPTRASLLHITAHPDDEHGGMRTLLSRGRGVRVALVSLTRGEAGANAIGSELFDALGWIRAEELAAAGRYYGLDRLYFTRLVDYGFSKRLEEALGSWDRERALEDLVYLIRLERPLVLVSRFQGNERDGHGQHQFAGMLSRAAFESAGDPNRFPEQLTQGLAPWQPLKLYSGGLGEEEDWNVSIDSGSGSPWLGDSYENVARKGLSFQRSQNGGRLNRVAGKTTRHYRRIETRVPAPDEREREQSFFDGIDIGLSALGEDLEAATQDELRAIERLAREALGSFDWLEPAAIVPLLTEALSRLRAVREPSIHSELIDKERQLVEAIVSALSLELTATAAPEPNEPSPSSFAAPPLMGPLTPGEIFEVRVSLANRGSLPVTVPGLRLVTPPEWRWSRNGEAASEVAPGEELAVRFRVESSDASPLWSPHVRRDSIAENHYQSGGEWYRGAPPSILRAQLDLVVGGVEVSLEAPVERWEEALPYGYQRRELAMLPPISVSLEPANGILPLRDGGASFPVKVVLRNVARGGVSGVLALDLPEGFASEPGDETFRFERAGESRSFSFRLSTAAVEDRIYQVTAAARIGDDVYSHGYEIIAHRDLETRYLRRPALSRIRGLEVAIPEGLSVGYVMGVGDELPEAIAQLGARVELLGDTALATEELSRYDAIVVGTRAYAVRADLRRHNRRLLDYAYRGGNLVVLYNTPEFLPDEFAPFPGELPSGSEEVSEEDAPVTILAPDAPVFTRPNRITLSDFDDWVEQRGSKFWSRWDARYLPMLQSQDGGQAPQQGGWLWARYGEGHYTYFAYALHRQLPYGVGGAFRILANLLSLGRE